MTQSALVFVTALCLSATQATQPAAWLCATATSSSCCCQPTGPDAGCDVGCSSGEVTPEVVAAVPLAREFGDQPFQLAANVSTAPAVAVQTLFHPPAVADRLPHGTAQQLYLLYRVFRC